MFSGYIPIQKVNKPDDKELLLLLDALTERTNDMYYIVRTLTGNRLQSPLQLINRSALNRSNVWQYIYVVNYIINDLRKKMEQIGQSVYMS